MLSKDFRQAVKNYDAVHKADETNPYYTHISSVYGALKWGTLLLFAGYLLIMLFVGRDSITYENFLYLMRDLNVSSGSGAFSSIVYEEQQNMAFGAYKNGLIVAGSSGVSMYDASGTVVLHDSVSYKSPVIVSGEKYMLLYDAGGTEFSVFTTLSCVNRGNTEGAILCAAVGDNGNFAVVSQTNESKYVIVLYGSDFRERVRYYKDTYVSGIAFNGSGDVLAVFSIASDNWAVSSQVSFCTMEGESLLSVPLGDGIPLSARYLANGNLVIVCDQSVFYLDSSGNICARIPFSAMTLSSFDISENKVALVLLENTLENSNRVLVLDSTGETLYDVSETEKIDAVTASSGRYAAYISCNDTVKAVSSSVEDTVRFTGHLLTVCETAGCAVLCFSTGAEAFPQTILS